MSSRGKDNEIYITRVYDAPVSKIWDAWTNPEQVGKWWGPRGFTITTHSSDVKTGGSWHYTMHGPDGKDWENVTKYLEVQKHARMVYDHGASADRPPMFRVTVNFSEQGGKTTMEMAMALPTAEAARKTKEYIKAAGGDATWDRLAEFLSPTDIFVINRSFPTSQSAMFALWTKPELITQWACPAGFTMEYIEADIRPGGTAFYRMEGAGGAKMFGKAHYKEIRESDRVVYTQNFCDESGKTIRHPMAPTWPETMLTTVTLTAEGTGQTRVTLVWEVSGEATAAERETFHKAKAGMTQGWTGSFDKLEDYLS